MCDVFDATPISVGEDFEYHSCSDSFVAMSCNRCGLVFLSPCPTAQDLDTIYPSTYHAYDFTPEKFGFVHGVRRKLEARRLLQVCGFLGDSASILDVGCGDGFHLRLLREFGRPSWTLQGVDASSRAVARAREQGLAVDQGHLEDVPLPVSSFDLILLIATLEHVQSPPNVLLRARQLLRPGGRIVIVTDNIETLDFKIWKKRHWGGYHFPRHFNLFSLPCLSKLARQCGLTVHQGETIVSPVNWVYSIRNWLSDMGAPRMLVEQFSLKAPLPLAVFTLWDQLFSASGHGALLRVTLTGPVE